MVEYKNKITPGGKTDRRISEKPPCSNRDLYPVYIHPDIHPAAVTLPVTRFLFAPGCGPLHFGSGLFLCFLQHAEFFDLWPPVFFQLILISLFLFDQQRFGVSDYFDISL
jgi:hypothetical protein